MTPPPRVGWMRLSGSVKLRWARSGGPPSGPRSGLPLFIMPEDGPGPSSSCGGGRVGLGGANRRERRRLVGDPVRHLVAAPVGTMGAILLGIRRLGARKPRGHF